MPNHPAPNSLTKHQSHPKEFTCPHTKLNYCAPCDAVECPACGIEWVESKKPVEEKKEVPVSTN